MAELILTNTGNICLLDEEDYIHLGYFDTEIQAAQAYNEFCIKHNNHARLNLIKEF